MGIDLISAGEKIPSIGRTLFVSENGSTTLTRAQALGKINKPVSLQRAFDICQNGDCIHIFNGDYNGSYTLSSRNDIFIYYEINNDNVINKISTINLVSCSYIDIVGGGNNGYILNLNATNCSGYLSIKSVLIGFTLTINTSSTLNLFAKSSLIQGYNISAAYGSRADISECTTYTNMPAISTGYFMHFYNYRTRKLIARINSGKVVFDNCILGENTTLHYHRFDSLSGSAGTTEISYKNCIIHNTLPSVCDSTNPNITRLEMQNCVLLQHITSGRIPDSYNGIIIDSNLITGNFL
jgi:hypothetical protein